MELEIMLAGMWGVAVVAMYSDSVYGFWSLIFYTIALVSSGIALAL